MREAATADAPLRDGVVTQLVERARDVWARRELLYEFALRDVRIRYRQAALGILWALLMPALTVLASIVLRLFASNGALGAAVGGREAIAGVVVKAVAWSFFAGAVTLATGSLASNASLLGRVYFPREILPLAAVSAQGVDLLAGTVTAIVLLVVLGVGIIGPALLWAPVLIVLLIALAAAMASLLACANLFFRDVRYMVQVLLTFGMFFTPVFFDATQIGARAGRIMMLNPVAPLLEGLRLAVVNGHNLARPLVLSSGAVAWEPWHLAYSAAFATCGVVAAALLYSRLELAFAEYV
jgi:ABC-type polysaccharide/polyol phosphate export permease